MAYLDPYQRPAPDRFVRRWLFITACIAALMLLWQFLSAIEAWFSPREAAERTVMARGDLAADEKTTIELFEKSRASVVYITTAQLVRDVWTRNVFSVPRGTGSGFIWDDAGTSSPTSTSSRARPKPPSNWPTAATTRPRWWGRAPRTTSPCSRSASVSSARRPCRSAPVPTSRWVRRCLLSATPSAWTGRSPLVSSPRSTARCREKRAARPSIT